MRVAVEQLLRLQQESGSIKKQAILRENKDNEDFRRLLYYALFTVLAVTPRRSVLDKSFR